MRLLAVRLSAFGDVIHTIPAVVGLRDAGHRIAWVVEGPYREMVEIVAGVETIPVSMKRWGWHPIASRGEMRATLASIRGFDASIDFQGLLKSTTFALFSGAKMRYGFSRDLIREKGASLFVNRPVRVDPARHVVEWNVDLARGVEPSIAGVPKVDFTPFATHDPRPTARDPIVLLPSAGKANKLWPAERFRELARLLGDDVLVAWGPGERELAESIGAPLAPETTLRELAALLHRARLVVGGDTGPLHLAAALGTPVVGIFGPTNPVRNGPYGQIDHCVERWSTTRSMQTIPVADVMGKIEEVLR